MAIFALIYTCLSFVAYWLLYFWARNRLDRYFHEEYAKNIGFAIYHRLLGFLLFGFIPLIVGVFLMNEHSKDLGLLLDYPKAFLAWCAGIMILLIPFNMYTSKTTKNQASYPQIRIQQWTSSLFLLNAGLWILYLLGYEFLFRGMLFFSTLSAYGFWPAVLSNSILYGLVHIPKGKVEVGGAFVFGVALCLGCYYTGGFWFAFFMHSFQAIFNEFNAIRYNPEMAFSKEGEVSTYRDKLN